MTNRLMTSGFAALAVLLSGLISTAGYAQAGETAAFLQDFPRDFDRRDLARNITFASDNGTELAGVKCGTRSVGQFEHKMIEAAVGDLLTSRGRSHRHGEVTVPVFFHVVKSSDGRGHVKKKHIKRQIRVLNRAYKNAGFSFELQAIKRYKDDDFAGGCLDYRTEMEFKSRHAIDPARTLNVYSCRPADGLLGYSYLPWDYPETSVMHGVVLLYSTLPKGSAAPYNLGDTLTHEVGHYLGLLHTFEGQCTDGDGVADTPAEQSPAYGCPIDRNTCSAPGDDPVRNFMNYTVDSCMNRFSSGQADRMHDAVATFRASL